MAYSANYAAGSWTAVSLSPGDGSGVGVFNHRQYKFRNYFCHDDDDDGL